jgi:hypothetical protein
VILSSKEGRINSDGGRACLKESKVKLRSRVKFPQGCFRVPERRYSIGGVYDEKRVCLRYILQKVLYTQTHVYMGCRIQYVEL